jgi:hypothetical protein
MNTLFGDMAANLATFNPEEEAISVTRAEEVRDEIIRLNFEDQLYVDGELSDGTKLPPYRPTTVIKKLGYREGDLRAKPYERDDSGARFRDTRVDQMTLKDTGFFQRSAKVKYGTKKFQITADDKKYSDDGTNTVYLTDIYGNEILGLNQENLKSIIDRFVRPKLNVVFRHRLFANKNTF